MAVESRLRTVAGPRSGTPDPRGGTKPVRRQAIPWPLLRLCTQLEISTAASLMLTA